MCSGEWTVDTIRSGPGQKNNKNDVSWKLCVSVDWSRSALCRSGALIIESSSDYRPSQGRQSASYEAMATVEYPRLTPALVIQSILPIFTPMCHRVNPSCLKLGCVSRLWYQQWITQRRVQWTMINVFHD